MKSLLIYLPSVVLLMISVASPQMGRNLAGKMNAHELAILLAFWWMVCAIGFKLIRRMIRDSRRSHPRRGFDVRLRK